MFFGGAVGQPLRASVSSLGEEGGRDCRTAGSAGKAGRWAGGLTAPSRPISGAFAQNRVRAPGSLPGTENPRWAVLYVGVSMVE